MIWVVVWLLLSALAGGVFACPAQAEPDSSAIYQGRRLLAAHKAREAVPLFDKALSAGEDALGAHIGLAEAYNELGKYKNALAEAQSAIALDSNSAPAYLAAAAAQLNLANLDAANSDCAKALKLAPNLARAHCLKALLLSRLKRYRDGMEEIVYAIKLNPADAYAFSVLSNLCFNLDEYDRAIAAATRAIERNADCAPAYFWRGQSYKELGRRELAAKDRQAAKRLGYRENN